MVPNQTEGPPLGVEPDMQELYKRGREAAMDLVKLGITLATGVIGAFFIVLTSKEKSKLVLPQNESFLLPWTLICMVICIGSGLLGLGAHAGFYSAWAAGEEKSKSKKFYQKTRKISFFITVISFAVGMILAARWVFLISKHTT